MTILDIAQLAGTSKSTVSRYFNGGSVSRRSAEKIEKALSSTTFLPNENARRLANSRSHTLGIVFDDIANYIYGDMIAGFQETAHACGYTCTFYSRAVDSRDEASYLSLFSSSMVDGLAFVSVGRRSRHQVDALVDSQKNIVVIGDAAGHTSLPAIDVDNEGGTYSEVTDLIKAGHRIIAYLEGPAHMPAAQARKAGYLRALRDSDIPVEEQLICMTNWSVSDAHHAVSCLLKQHTFTALAGSNAYSTYGGLMALQDAGFRVPHDVVVVGFDDDPLCEHTRPAITTLKQPFRTIGGMAVEQLVGAADRGERRSGQVLVPPTLIHRQTTL